MSARAGEAWAVDSAGWHFDGWDENFANWK